MEFVQKGFDGLTEGEKETAVPCLLQAAVCCGRAPCV